MLLKIDGIRSLQDARFAAAEGIDFLVFNFVTGDAGKVSSALVKEIQGWLSGPQIGMWTETTGPGDIGDLEFSLLQSSDINYLQKHPNIQSLICMNSPKTMHLPSDISIQYHYSEIPLTGNLDKVWVELPNSVNAELLSDLQNRTVKGVVIGSSFFDDQGSLNYDFCLDWLEHIRK
ncbi:MAG: hypothetical protein EBS07_00135 [Sphingobacteriia bacterium]|nr:hypothetical protein [Sphingobacteriia bacterium]